MTVKTDELRRLAEQATPGPWTLREYSPIDVVGADGMEVAESFPEDRGAKQGQADAAYIAAASPDVIRSLLDERDRLVRLHQVTEKQGMGWADRALAAESKVAALEEALRECVQSWDGGLIDKDFDRMSNIFDAARALLQDKDKVTP